MLAMLYIKILLFLLLHNVIAWAQYSNESEVGQTTTGGNAESQLVNFRQLSKYTINNKEFKLEGRYLYGEANEKLNVRNWNVKLTYTHNLTERFGFQASQQAEGNPFQGYYERFNTDMGGVYHFRKPKPERKDDYTRLEVGLRYSKENRIRFDPNFDSSIAQTRTAYVFSRKLNQHVIFKEELEMVGNIQSPGRFQASNTMSVQASLNSLFSLKITYILRYDDYLPSQNLKPLDYIYTTSLLAKF
jgi:putative salt-induced outer membrane protein